MNLTTRYLGLDLPHPFMADTSALGYTLSNVHDLEAAGASAIVLGPLVAEAAGPIAPFQFNPGEYVSAEACTFRPNDDGGLDEPERYLERLNRIRSAVTVPVIAALSGSDRGGWLDYAKFIQEAGADALELNIYSVPTAADETGDEVEKRALEIVGAVRQEVTIPIAVKLSPFWSSLCHMGLKFTEIGVNGLVLFNRFYDPDIDLEDLRVVPHLEMATSAELRLRLRWLGLLHGRAASLAVAGGIHTAIDAVKAVMAGADALAIASPLRRHGPGYLTTLIEETGNWLEKKEYDSIRQMHGSMSLQHCPNPEAFGQVYDERALQS
jgi:dihydroorotate dehydrogenase (fumarate)